MSAYQAVALNTMAAMAGHVSSHPSTMSLAKTAKDEEPTAGARVKTLAYAGFVAVLLTMLVVRGAGIHELQAIEDGLAAGAQSLAIS